jgi:hypothetical protein
MPKERGMEAGPSPSEQNWLYYWQQWQDAEEKLEGAALERQGQQTQADRALADLRAELSSSELACERLANDLTTAQQIVATRDTDMEPLRTRLQEAKGPSKDGDRLTLLEKENQTLMARARRAEGEQAVLRGELEARAGQDTERRKVAREAKSVHRALKSQWESAVKSRDETLFLLDKERTRNNSQLWELDKQNTSMHRYLGDLEKAKGALDEDLADGIVTMEEQIYELQDSKELAEERVFDLQREMESMATDLSRLLAARGSSDTFERVSDELDLKYASARTSGPFSPVEPRGSNYARGTPPPAQGRAANEVPESTRKLSFGEDMLNSDVTESRHGASELEHQRHQQHQQQEDLAVERLLPPQTRADAALLGDGQEQDFAPSLDVDVEDLQTDVHLLTSALLALKHEVSNFYFSLHVMA